MYIEDQYIHEQFLNNFVEQIAGHIVIYGTGVHTQRLVEALPFGTITGLMDYKRTGENLWGYPVLDYDEVAELGDAVIVILARNAVINVIYRRIEKFARDHGIDVYDINKNNLHDKRSEDIDSQFFSLNETILREKIQKSSVITFDIFDTLINRCVLKPRDIFSVMDIELKGLTFSFSKARIEAEDSFEIGYNPTIYEIYERIQVNVGISKVEADQLLQLELATEKRFFKRRESVCKLLTEAVDSGKRVYLISDMYFSKDMLVEILDSLGIHDYIDVFVSSEWRVSKQEGLFEVFLRQSGEKAGDCLHIGDNLFSDCHAAGQVGMETFQIYSVTDMLENGIYRKAIEKANTIEHNIVLGYFARMVYDSPFVGHDVEGRLKTSSVDKMTKSFIAPVLLKYVLWLVGRIKSDFGCVLFPARDGYILQLLYEKVKCKLSAMELPESLYLYTSRRASMIAAAQNEEDIRNICYFPYSGDAVSLIRSRFGIELVKSSENTDLDGLIERYMEELLELCSGERENYLRYLSENHLLEYDRIAFVDFVAMGSVQEALQRILGKKLFGYYFLRRSGDEPRFINLEGESLYPVSGDFQIDANIYKYYYFLENIVTSYEPSLITIDDSGNKLFYPESRDEEWMKMLKQVHESILTYADELLELLPNLWNTDASVGLYDTLLGFFSSDDSDIDIDALKLFTNVDEFMGKKVKDINR